MTLPMSDKEMANGNVGIPLPLSMISIFKPGTQEELGYNQLGEICECGPGVMLGYDTEEATADVLQKHADGRIWLHTGDIGYMEEDGSVHAFTRGAAPRYGGGDLATLQMENLVADANIAGIHDEFFVVAPDNKHSGYYLPYLYVMLEEGYSVEDVEDEIRACLEKHMLPVRITELPERPFFHFKTNSLGLKSEILASGFGEESQKKEKKEKVQKGQKGYKEIPKVLDTSVIIDGRIYDICQTGFIEGPLVIPSFVLDELRHISDSSDSLKRVRGRRGLDILNKIQKEVEIETQIWEGDFPKIQEVDAKLLKLAQTLEGKVITNDYNLNKVAEVQGVPVLNINELSNAIKAVVIPGEEMVVEVVKEGKEQTQGVAYLDDGTMIVVEDGRKHMTKTIGVIVTSVLQTAAGRMIFAKPKE